jgi:serine/threonine-protein kinase
MLPPGTVVDDRYELIDHVASGGMGVVYRARDRRLSREVAVKFLHPGLADDPGFRERFEREARAAAAISHPGLVSVFDHGQAEEGPYLVMELLSARTLADDLAERGPLPADEAVRLIRLVAEAVGAAHAAGVTHRDLKPSNVLFAPDGRPKVADFGLARSGGRLTQTGEAVGSVHYLSPEQARGEPAGPASDVYSLGAILFQLVTGQVPFDAETPVAVAYRHVHDEPPVPSEVRPDLDLPGWLDDLVLRALAKDVADRPADAGVFAAELGLAPTQEKDERSTTSPIPVIVAGSLPDDDEDEDELAGEDRRSMAGRLVVLGSALAILLALGLVARALFFPQEVTARPDGTRPIPGPSVSSSPSPRPSPTGQPGAGPSGPSTSAPASTPASTGPATTAPGTTAPATTAPPATTTPPPASPSPSPSASPTPVGTEAP